MKRFWDRAEAVSQSHCFIVQLDGKAMRIPGGTPLHLGTAALADAIAAEWQDAGGRKGGDMTLDDVPLTRLAGTAQDRIAPDPAPVAESLAKYAETDLLCYRAERPMPLVLRQTREWQPWLDWLATRFGIRLATTAGLAVITQDPGALRAVRAVLDELPAPALAGLSVAVPALGSVVLGLALHDGAIEAEAAYRVACLEELYQEEQWGADHWARKRRADIGKDVALAARYLTLARAA